jgi:hypothetical protein
MPELALVGPSYRLESPAVDIETTMNLFIETLEQGPRAGKRRLRIIPGLKLFTTLPKGPVRALWSNDSTAFAIGADTLYQIFNDGTPPAAVGVMSNSVNPATMTSNGTSLGISSNGLAYLGLGVGLGVAPLFDTNGDPIRAKSLAFLGQYFIAALVDSKEIMISNLAPDGGTWDPSNVAIKEAYSDNIVRCWVDDPGGQYLWLFGNDTTEIWTQTADLFPFSRIQGGVLSIGCDAEYSVAGVAGNRFWLWHNTIWWATGFAPQRVSDYAVEQAIRSYNSYDQANAEAFSWIDGGHVFYAISFPMAGKTWVFDIKEKAWHERAYFSNGAFGRYRPRVYTHGFKKHLVGDYATGDIYELDPKTFTDARGVPLVRDRITSYITDDMRMARYNKLTVDMDTGIGLPVAPGQPGFDPQVLFRYSNNRGKNWSDERSVSAGRQGVDDTRVIFENMGSSRIGMSFWLRMTEPVPTSYNTAFLDVNANSIRPRRD